MSGDVERLTALQAELDAVIAEQQQVDYEYGKRLRAIENAMNDLDSEYWHVCLELDSRYGDLTDEIRALGGDE